MLQKIQKNVLEIYRELYKTNWPKYAATFCLIDHFIKRIEKYPEWNEKVNFYRLSNSDTEIDYDATFVCIYGNHIYFDSITSDYVKLEDLLNLIDYEKEIFFVAVRDEFRNVIHNVLRINSFQKTIDVGVKCCIAMPFEGETDLLNIPLPEGYHFADLKEEDIDIICQNWTTKAIPVRREYIEIFIKYNTTTGLYRNNTNELIAWIMIMETGAVGGFHVLKKYQRHNFATYLFLEQRRKMIENGRNFGIGYIVHSNRTGLKFHSNYPYSCFCCASTIGARYSTDESIPLRGHL